MKHKSILKVNKGVFLFCSICLVAVGVLVMAYGFENKSVICMSKL